MNKKETYIAFHSEKERKRCNMVAGGEAKNVILKSATLDSNQGGNR